ncbi:MAG: IclR family transcriptional regulator [Candidatus Dormibacteraeota bacterium]|nr:IclR family transcriptional regulator [Candidatus Dormibacteraeota bacterium]
MNNHLERRASIQSIDRAAAILRLLASGSRQHGVSELADQLGLVRSTVRGLLQTLGYSYLDRNELRSRSIGHADHLANRTGMAVRVVVRHEASAIVIHHILRPAATFQTLEIGLQLPLHASAVGKAILAFLPDSESRDLLSGSQPRLTKHTATAASLRTEIKVIRESALATERDEAVLGESSLAAPIFDHAGNVIGAIGVVDATEVIFPRGIAKGRAAAVLEAARGISRELGATHWPPPT